MTRKRPYMPLYIDRWRGGTETMAPKHRGPYLDLLCAIWAGGGSLKNDPRVIMSACRLDARQFASFWSACAGKFLVSESEIQHATVTEMLDAACKIAAKLQQNRTNKRKNLFKKQGSQKQNYGKPNQGLVSPSYEGEKPNLSGIQKNVLPDASPPSPEGGGGEASASGEWVPLPAAVSAMMEEIRRLAPGKISLLDVRNFRNAVRGERAGRPVLSPNYKPPDAISEIINRPTLKAIEGGKQ